jgi:hypothetical protein
LSYFASFLPLPNSDLHDAIESANNSPGTPTPNAAITTLTRTNTNNDGLALFEQLHVATTPVLFDTIVVLLDLFLSPVTAPTMATQHGAEGVGRTPFNHTRVSIRSDGSNPDDTNGNTSGINHDEYYTTYSHHQDHQRQVLNTFTTVLDVSSKLILDLVNRPLAPTNTFIYGFDPDHIYTFILSVTRLLAHNISFNNTPIKTTTVMNGNGSTPVNTPKKLQTSSGSLRTGPKSVLKTPNSNNTVTTAPLDAELSDAQLGSFHVLLPLAIQQTLLSMCANLLTANSSLIHLRLPKHLYSEDTIRHNSEQESTLPPLVDQVRVHQHTVLASLFAKEKLQIAGVVGQEDSRLGQIVDFQ